MPIPLNPAKQIETGGRSSTGRAPPLQGGGCRFEPDRLQLEILGEGFRSFEKKNSKDNELTAKSFAARLPAPLNRESNALGVSGRSLTIERSLSGICKRIRAQIPKRELWFLLSYCELAFDHFGQIHKGVWGMSWRQKAMKGVEGCEKPGEAVKQALIPGFPNYCTLNT